MFSKTLDLDDDSWTLLLSLYGEDAAFKARVDESARRVLASKLKWLLPRGKEGIGPAADAAKTMQSPESREFFAEQAVRSATLLGAAQLPLPATGRAIVAGPFGDFMLEAQARMPEAEQFRFSYQPSDETLASELAAFGPRLSRADTAVVCVANPAGARFAEAARKAGKRLYVVSSLNPTYSFKFEDYGAVVAVYSYARESFKAAFAVLAGDVEAPGRLPIQARP